MGIKTCVYTAIGDSSKYSAISTYAPSLVSQLKADGVNATYMNDTKSNAPQIVNELCQAKQANPSENVVFHLVVNENGIQDASVTPEQLKQMKKAGIDIVITCLAYPKELQAEQSLDNYFQYAANVSFANKADRTLAMQQSKIIPKLEQSGRVNVIPIPGLKVKKALSNSALFNTNDNIPVTESGNKKRRMQFEGTDQENLITFPDVSSLYLASYRREADKMSEFLCQQFPDHPQVVKKLISLHDKLEIAMQKFNRCNSQSPEFYDRVHELFKAIDDLRMNIEIGINNISPIDNPDSTKLRSDLLDKLVEPYFTQISSPQNQKKITQGVLANQKWVEEVADRSVRHGIGFFKAPIVALGGYEILLDGDPPSVMRYPNIELRMHFYTAAASEVSGELLHKHGFDLYSRVSQQGVLVDQQFFIQEKPMEQSTKSTLDKYGLDVPEYTSEAKQEAHALDHLHIDMPTQDKHNKYKAVTTYRYPHVATLVQDEKDKTQRKYVVKKGADGKEVRDIALFSPTKRYSAMPLKANPATGDSTRLHLSENPHYVITAGGTHTCCVTLRRPDLKGKEGFKPSAILVTKETENLALPALEYGVAIKKRQNLTAITPDELRAELGNFNQTLDKEIAYNEMMRNATPIEAMKNTLSNLLNILIKTVGKETNDSRQDIINVMKPTGFNYLETHIDESLITPTVYRKIFHQEVQEKIIKIFNECYGEEFTVNNPEHINKLKEIQPRVPYNPPTAGQTQDMKKSW